MQRQSHAENTGLHRPCGGRAFDAPRHLEELIYHMRSIAMKAENDWARGFALSIVRQSRKRGWHPSPKQEAMMRTMVSEMFLHAHEQEGEFSLIED